MTQPLATLIKGLMAGEHGFTKSAKERAKRVAKDERRCLEEYESSRMFFERFLFNRNTLQMAMPSQVFSESVREQPALEMSYRCAISELGGERFSESEGFPYFSGGDQEKHRADAYARYKNIPLRLGEKNAEKVVEAFEAAWPPVQYDECTIGRLEAMVGEHPEAFDAAAVNEFLANSRRELASFGRLAPGKEALRGLLLKERFRTHALMTLPLWEARFDNELFRDIVGALAEDFAELGYERHVITGFTASLRTSFSNYYGSMRGIDDEDFDYEQEGCLDRYGALLSECLVPEARAFFDEFVATSDEEDCEFLVDDFWAVINKAAVVYNLFVCAIYGPAQARDNCYVSMVRGTNAQRARELWDYAPEELLPKTGQALLRQIDKASSRHLVVIDLDNPPKFGDAKLICVFGSDFEKGAHPMPTTKNAACSFFAGLDRDACAGAFCKVGTADEGVSGWHAGIAWVNGKVTFVDLASKNGSYVAVKGGPVLVAPTGPSEVTFDGRRARRVPSVVLSRGDVILLSNVAIEVV